MRTRVLSSVFALMAVALFALNTSAFGGTLSVYHPMSITTLSSLVEESPLQKQCTIRVVNRTNHTITVCATPPGGKPICITLAPGQSGNLIVPCGVVLKITVTICKTALALDAGQCAETSPDDPAGDITACFSDDGSTVTLDGGNDVPTPCDVQGVQ
ncbi:MAG: hypothetical protein JST22_16390 [Bacteroidetes bacterium]|nr:hypothetical protein [Bacteroidota bacterium]